ncbi:unnamed protein product, partial [Choristocarpus tenellus]
MLTQNTQASFQSVCEALLQHGDTHRGLCRLPSKWLDQLLDRLRGAKQEFVLRRSAGFALSFLSLLKAEPRHVHESTGMNVSPSLLPHGMQTLLNLAQPPYSYTPYWIPTPEGVATEKVSPATGAGPEQGGGGDNWRARVHSLNILRLMFLDATLADDVAPYVTEAMMASVWGFKDSNWAVRNSSMMLFSSVTQRAVGGEKNVGMCKATFTPGETCQSRSKSTHRAATVQAFFQLHSRLHPFLLGELDIATKHSGTSHNSEDQDKEEREPVQSEGRVPQMHPVLYPILLLLARLRSDGNEWDSASTSNEVISSDCVTGSRETSAAADFVPMILRCRSNPHYLARVASARALAALVPPDRVPGIVADLAGGLPNDPSALLHAGAHNHVHGTLLQMLELIRALHIGQVAVPKGHPSGGEGINMSLERPLRSSSIITKLIAAGVEVTLQQVWLADPVKSLSPSIRALTLKVLEAFALCKKPGSNNYYSPGALGIVEDPGLALEAALHSAQNANTVHALQRQPSVLKSIVPGQSLLISSCVHEVVRRTICQQVMSTNGRGHVMAAERKGGIGVVDLHLELGSCLALISSTDCDVRDAAIKGVKRALRGSIGVDEMDKRERCRSGNITPSDGPGGRSRECIDQLQEMWEQVARAVPNEPHPPNVRRLLRILCRIGAHLKVQNAWGGSTTTGVGKDTFWAYLRTQCLDGKGRGGDIHANALEVMGFLLSSDAEHHETLGDGENDGIAEEWLDLVEEGADPEQPVAVRLATAASIAASGV